MGVPRLGGLSFQDPQRPGIALPYSKPCALELLFRQYISVFQNCLVSLNEGSPGALLFVKEKSLCFPTHHIRQTYLIVGRSHRLGRARNGWPDCNRASFPSASFPSPWCWRGDFLT